MSATQLTIALAAAALINQWAIAIFNKRAKQAIPKTKPVSSVATKAGRSLHQYVGLGADLILLVFTTYGMWSIVSAAPDGIATIKMSALLAFLAILIAFNFYKVVYGVLGLLFP